MKWLPYRVLLYVFKSKDIRFLVTILKSFVFTKELINFSMGPPYDFFKWRFSYWERILCTLKKYQLCSFYMNNFLQLLSDNLMSPFEFRCSASQTDIYQKF